MGYFGAEGPKELRKQGNLLRNDVGYVNLGVNFLSSYCFCWV